jgi:hypothetical protein
MIDKLIESIIEVKCPRIAFIVDVPGHTKYIAIFLDEKIAIYSYLNQQKLYEVSHPYVIILEKIVPK